METFKKVLVTCPPMIRMLGEFRAFAAERHIELVGAEVVQSLSEQELIQKVPEFEGWIIGDDPATGAVFAAGKRGRLKAAVRWGIGIDNVDFEGSKLAGYDVKNTPGMFGREVADIATSYVTALARSTFQIDQGVKHGLWPKPIGISLAGRCVAIVGFGDIGRNTAKRLLAAEMKIIVYDPGIGQSLNLESVVHATWPNRLEEADFIILTCSLTKENRHMIGWNELRKTKRGVRIINVARGALIDETALAEALKTGIVTAAALEVFEVEPLPNDSPLRPFRDRCIFGSHNASNTQDAVRRTSLLTISMISDLINNCGTQ